MVNIYYKTAHEVISKLRDVESTLIDKKDTGLVEN